jgi:hypothetical protein
VKTFLIITISIISLTAAAQFLINKSSAKTEQHEYEVIKKYDDFEIRQYKPALFSSVILNVNTYKESSNQGFRILAGYIFGDNEQGQKIAMTSPVAMEIDSNSKMMFMVPAEYSEATLPKPTNDKIQFERREAKIMAAIRFGGWANDEKIADYERKLSEALSKENIQVKGKFMYFGYNPPYEIINRRNEVVVEVVYSIDKSSN